MSNISYILTFYNKDGFTEEYYYNTMQEAKNHLLTFTADELTEYFNGFSVVEYNWATRKEKD